MALAAVVHEDTGRSLDSYITHAIRRGGYFDHAVAVDHGLLEWLDEAGSEVDDEDTLTAACDFLASCLPLVDRIAMTLHTSTMTLRYKDVLLLKDAPSMSSPSDD